MRTAVWIAILAGSAFAQPQQDLGARMQIISQGLGVTCGYCHTAERGSGQPEPKKDIARAMIAMTRDINQKIEASAGPAAAKVDCITCHRGVAIPKQLTEILNQTIREKGVQAAIDQYRDLHARYYGRAAYDFGDATIINVAQPMATRAPDDALALLNAHLELHPQSARTMVAISYAYTRKFDDATAITYLEKALALDPENGAIQGQLAQLKSYRRRR
jgi:tetratricopeptide (TPR) repeat protein